MNYLNNVGTEVYHIKLSVWMVIKELELSALCKFMDACCALANGRESA